MLIFCSADKLFLQKLKGSVKEPNMYVPQLWNWENHS